MIVLVQSALTNYCRLGGLNKTDLHFTVLEAGKLKIRVPGWLGSGENSLTGLHMAVFQLCPHMGEGEGGEGEGEREILFVSLLIGALILFTKPPSS